jgi:hypothetical protein
LPTLAGCALQVVQSQAFSMNGKQLAMTGWGLARLGWAPDPLWLSTLAQLTLPALHQLPHASLSNLLWAMGRWGKDPGGRWSQFFERVFRVFRKHKLQIIKP